MLYCAMHAEIRLQRDISPRKDADYAATEPTPQIGPTGFRVQRATL